ncbi:LysR family transcriptional regulator [Oribacterium sp. WCC10]|uniref:LysR family transcriptional regulator n=1 Tax=Oribacterium sp. WCC10 TaxID=1855343 RepID=UPI0008E30152|nr:LysR family transcriptional regulator [Oribacterium sp. WCC10]SFG77532.1 DNA-binding transcriptional regulator, LysR family [Oribacterium sp. WCC10]
MDFRICEYIVEIEKEENITKAAKNLFISQSALNQQLLKLEKDLGTQLFFRSRTDWHPTEAGKIYLEGAKRALLIKQETYKKIHDITHAGESELKIGLTPGRGIHMFTSIYPELHSKFSNQKFSPIEMGVYKQKDALQNGDIDIGFVTLREDQRGNYDYTLLGKEEMVVLVPSVHPQCENYSLDNGQLPVINLKNLEYEPFTLMSSQSSNRQIIDDIFSRNGFIPSILMETNHTASIPSLVETSLCCAIIPRFYIDPHNKHYKCFALPSHPSWDLCIATRKGSYLTDAEKEFIKLAKNYWNEHLIPVQTN